MKLTNFIEEVAQTKMCSLRYNHLRFFKLLHFSSILSPQNLNYLNEFGWISSILSEMLAISHSTNFRVPRNTDGTVQTTFV